MPLPLLTRHAEGAAGDDGHQGASLWSPPSGDAGGTGSAKQLLPPPGGHARPAFRARSGPRRLRAVGPTLHRPGRLLQAPPGAVLRGAALRTSTHAGRGRPAQPALTPSATT